MIGSIAEGLRQFVAPEAANMEVDTEGPGAALTPHGHAVGVRSGSPINFDQDKELGHDAAERAREERHRQREQKYAMRTQRVDNEEAASIDESGILHGARAMPPPLSGESHEAERLKLFHKKQMQRHHAEEGDHHHPDFCADDEGHIQPVRAHSEPHLEDLATEGHQVSVDSDGVVHESPTLLGHDRADRLKKFYRKRHAREHDSEDDAHTATVLDEEGHVVGKIHEERKPVVEHDLRHQEEEMQQ